MIKFSEGEFTKALKYIKSAHDCYQDVYESANTQMVVELVKNDCDPEGLIASWRTTVAGNVEMLMSLYNAMDQTQKDNLSQNSKEYSWTNGDLDASYGTFDDYYASGTGVNYSDYESYQFSVISGKTFSNDYNDVYSFVKSRDFKCACIAAGLGELSNYGLLIDGLVQTVGLSTGAIDEFTDEMLENSLSGILAAVVENSGNIEVSDVTDTVSDSIDSYFEKYYNLKYDASKMKEVFLECYKKYKDFKDPVAEVLKDPDFVECIEDWPDLQKNIFYSIVGGMTSTGVLSNLETATEVIEYAFDIAFHAVNDYTVQISYLDTMKDALLTAGFAEDTPLMRKVEELRDEFSSDWMYFMNETLDGIESAVKKWFKKGCIGALDKHLPGAKTVTFGISLADKVADMVCATEISAVKGLGGLVQYDSVLTTAYEKYVDKMQLGIATEADMQQADQLYQLLKQTKAKEYECMVSLEGYVDEETVIKYREKYQELTGEYLWDGKQYCNSGGTVNDGANPKTVKSGDK